MSEARVIFGKIVPYFPILGFALLYSISILWKLATQLSMLSKAMPRTYASLKRAALI